MNYLIEYYNEINKGNIIVGEELKTQLDQLINDLDNPLYSFDEQPGNLELILLKLSANIQSLHSMVCHLFLNYGKKHYY